MKRVILWIITVVLILSLSFVGIGCKEEAAPAEEEVAPAEEEVAEEAAPEVEEPWPPITIEGLVPVIGKGPAGNVSVDPADLFLGDYSMQDYIDMSRDYNFDFADPEIVEKVKGKKAAITFHVLESDWTLLQIKGIEETLEVFGIETVSVTGSGWSAEKMTENIENIITMDVDLMFGAPVDPSANAPIFKKAAESGINIILTTILPEGFVYPEDYVTNVASTDAGIGAIAADQMAYFLTEMGLDEAKVGVIQINYYLKHITDRVSGFTDRVADLYPWIDIAVEIDYDGSMESAYASAEATLTANQDLNGFFADWQGPALEVATAARTLGFDPAKFVITTSDLEETGAVDMASDGFLKGTGAQDPYANGVAEAIAAIMFLIGEDVPPHIATPAYAITKNNLLDSYEFILRREPPQEIIDLLE